eukprot:g6293.t1
MVITREEDEGVELADLSLNDGGSGDEGGERLGGEERPGEEGDRAPLLASDGNARAARRARRARKREAESTALRRRLRLLWKTLCGLLCLGTAVSTAVTLVAAIELRRHLGRSFFALPLSVHLLLDALMALTPLLAARSDGEGEPPPPVPTSQVEFQRQLRAGRTIAQARRRPQDDDDDPCGGVCFCFRLGFSRGTAAALALAYTLIDAAWCGFFTVVVLAAAWATAVEADGTAAPEWRGMHAALTTAAIVSAVAAGLRLLAVIPIAAYLRTRSRLVYVLRGTNEPPWHYAMSPRMQRLAIRQAGLFVAGSCVLVAIGVGSYVLHWTVDTGSTDHYDHCDPLDTTLCALPFPSSFFLEEAPPSSPSAPLGGASTGYRVAFGPKSLPFTRGRKNISPEPLNAFDGFSTLAPILFYVEGMSASGFVGPGDIGASLHANSTTWLIDADSGRMVPHFVELDAMDPTAALAVLQPAAPLRHGTRYIVAVCGALGDWGELLPPTPGFQELVEAAQADRMTKIRPDLRRRANRFNEEVFPVLRSTGLGGGSGSGSGSGSGDVRRRQQAVHINSPNSGGRGVAGEGWGDGEGLVGAGLGDVQLAWDFVTASEASQLGLLGAMRDISTAWLDAALSSAERSSTPSPPRHLLDLAASEGEEGVGAESESDRGQGGGVRSMARSGSRGKSGSGGGNSSDGGREQRRRRTASDSGQLLPAAAAPPYRVVKVEQSADHGDDGDDYSEHHPAIARTVWARMRVPAFVSASARGIGLVGGWETVDDDSGDGRGESGAGTKQPKSQATLEVGFVVRVPRCVATGKKKPTALVQYGHGLFGDRSEVLDGFLDIMAERGGWVMVAADWRGLSQVDITVMARALVSRPELLFSGIPEDLMQGFVNQEAVLALVSRRLRDFLGDGAMELSEQELGTVPLSFYGISQGAILGAGYTEFSSLIRRSVLGSGGTPFSLLMPRSVDFGTYHELLKLNVPNPRDVRLLLSLLQMSWDRLEVAAWLASDSSSSGGGDASGEQAKGKKAVLMQAGTGDAEVSVIGTEILARAFQATAVSPVAVPAWDIPAAADSTAASCQNASSVSPSSSSSASLALYDYRREASEVPDDDTPPPWGWVHLCVRHDPDAQEQVLRFIETGCVVNFCDGACERPYCRPA